MAPSDPTEPVRAPSEPDYARAGRRLGVAIAIVGYLAVGAFLTLGASVAFGATRDPTPTELALACDVVWPTGVAAFVVALVPWSTPRRRRLAAVSTWLVAVAGFLLAARALAARFPGYPELAPAEAVALRYALAGGAPGLVAIAAVTAVAARSWLARVAAPLAWVGAVVGVGLIARSALPSPIRDALPEGAVFRRLEFFNRTGSTRFVLRADLGRDEAEAVAARLGLAPRDGAMPPWEFPIAPWWTPPTTEGPRWFRVDAPEGGHGLRCSTFARHDGGTLFVQRRCDPE